MKFSDEQKMDSPFQTQTGRMLEPLTDGCPHRTGWEGSARTLAADVLIVGARCLAD